MIFFPEDIFFIAESAIILTGNLKWGQNKGHFVLTFVPDFDILLLKSQGGGLG